MWLVAAVIWLVCALAAALIASGKGLSLWVWGLWGFALGPQGVLAALGQPPNSRGLEKRALEQRFARRCPACAEVVRSEALHVVSAVLTCPLPLRLRLQLPV